MCKVLLDKERIHYGGISCYPCRQFFRRETNAGVQKTCRWRGVCVVSHGEKRICQACRYQKCLAIGMRRDLVLDTETRKKRFRQLNQYQEDNEEEQESVWDLSDESSDEGFEIPLVTEG